MTNDEFIEQLRLRFKDCNETCLIDIKMYVERIVDKKELLQYIINEYEFSTFPKLAWIRKLAYKYGIAEEKAKSKYVYYYKCLICGSYYNLKSRGCLKCRKITESIIIKSKEYPADMYYGKPNCFECKKWHVNISGANCRFWGKSEAMTDGQKLNCINCACSDCCSEEKETTFVKIRLPNKKFVRENGK